MSQGTRSVTPLVDATDAARFGHKAANLASLLRAGLDVPGGFVIPVDGVLSRDDLAAELAVFGDAPLAVRSSSVAEDLPDASFAGQYVSVLEVSGVEAVLDAARRVRDSATSTRARTYGGGQTGGMAVLVQRLVYGDASGVAFSANPVTGKRDEVVITATQGLGEPLVSGEVPGDEWTVTGGRPRLVASSEGAIDENVALRVAELAHRVEAHLGCPADIEWTVQGDRLVLLQARPITVLPTPPEIEKPKGSWQKDTGHYPEPFTPFGASTYCAYAMPGFNGIIERWGLLPDKIDVKVIGHEVYMHVEPDDGGKAPPPWWLLGILARVIPPLRKKLRSAQKMVDAGMLQSVPASWEAEHRPRIEKRIQGLAEVDLGRLDDAALRAHLQQVMDFGTEMMGLHFHLTIPYLVGVRDLVTTCEELLGYTLPETLRLVQGLSAASMSPTRELAAIAEKVRGRPEARAALGAPDAFERLSADAVVGDALGSWMRRWGLRNIGYDPGQPSYAERPTLVIGLLADQVDGTTERNVQAARLKAVGEARSRLSGDALARFDRVLAYAEIVYPQREDNSFLTDSMPAGLARRVGLEMGRRSVERGRLARATDIAMLTVDELWSSAELNAVVSKRRAEIAWVRANPGPAYYGPKPGAMPSLRGLPPAARLLNEALMWGLEEELTPAVATQGEDIGGLAASPGVVTGRVRVIRSAAEIENLRAGEVLVCPVTTPSWTVVFPRAAALVTDGGSLLSHAGIVAREHGIPAVVGTGDATRRLRDGQTVMVDGNRGVVRIVKG